MGKYDSFQFQIFVSKDHWAFLVMVVIKTFLVTRVHLQTELPIREVKLQIKFSWAQSRRSAPLIRPVAYSRSVTAIH